MTLTNNDTRLGEYSMPYCDPSIAVYHSEMQLNNQSSTDVKENGSVPDDCSFCRLRAKPRITRTKLRKRSLREYGTRK